MKIVVTKNFKLESEQIKRLTDLGEVVFLNNQTESKEELLKLFSDADIICAESEPIESVIYDLKNKLVSFPFVGVAWLDLKRLADNNVKIANSPGCNRASVSEWIIGMMINLSHQLLKYINIEEITEDYTTELMPGLAGKKVVILGAGNIGSRVGAICKTLEMDVHYFKRGGNLLELVKDVDFVVNCLTNNSETKGLLDKEFFKSFKTNSFFISITDSQIYDTDALIEAVDSNIIAGCAIDPAGIGIFDTKSETYLRLKNHPKIIVTPHIAFHSDMTTRVANDIMISNVEAWIKNKPINLVN